MTYEEIDFLRESNNIEDVWDDDSLAQAIFAWEFLKEQDEITPHVVLRTHKILMLHHLVGMYKGYFRQQQVSVGGREGKPWYVVPELIENWCKDMNEQIPATEEVCKEMHVRYEHIHPFVDGNGRTGRMFMNWQRIKSGLPILVIKESEKYDYYTWFK